MQNQCFFIGHSDAPATIYSKLTDEIDVLITQYGVRRFVVGHYGAFDHMCATAVAEAKQIYPGITLTMLLPYHPATHPVQLSPSFDDTLYPFAEERVPYHAAIVTANKYMIDHSNHLITYAKYAGSNSREMLQYAMKREKKGLLYIKNLADPI